MEQNDIYYVIFPVRLPLRDFSFIQIILFLRNAQISVLFLSLCFLFFYFFAGFARGQCEVYDMVAPVCLQMALFLHLSPFWANQNNLNTKIISTYRVLLKIASPWMHWTSFFVACYKTEAFWVLSRLDCLGLRAYVTYLLALLFDDVIKTSDWRKKPPTLARVRSKQGHAKQTRMRGCKEKNECEVKQMLQTRERMHHWSKSVDQGSWTQTACHLRWPGLDANGSGHLLQCIWATLTLCLEMKMAASGVRGTW